MAKLLMYETVKGGCTWTFASHVHVGSGKTASQEGFVPQTD